MDVGAGIGMAGNGSMPAYRLTNCGYGRAARPELNPSDGRSKPPGFAAGRLVLPAHLQS
jgi:hypothetical protein